MRKAFICILSFFTILSSIADDRYFMLLYHKNGVAKGVNVNEIDSIAFLQDSLFSGYKVFEQDTVYVVDSIFVLDQDSIIKLNDQLNKIKEEYKRLQYLLRRSVLLENGNVDKNGAIVQSDTTVITSIIPDNFYIQLNDGYAVYAGFLYNEQDKLVSSSILMPDVYYGAIDMFADTTKTIWPQRSYFATQSLPVGYGMRLILRRSDGTPIDVTENIVQRVGLMEGTELKRWTIDGTGFKAAQKRLKQVKQIAWTPKGKIPAAATKNYNERYYFENEMILGVPYSSVKEYDKFVPNEVGYRTFMSAVNNPHSLLYTEDVLGTRSQSEYGYRYHSDNCSSYYGGVCSSIVSYILGQPVPYASIEYANGSVVGLEEIQDPSAKNVQPLDVIWNSGHLSIIEDVYKDRSGEVKFICWAEETRPFFRSTPYTEQMFEERLKLKKCRVFRYSSLNQIEMPDDSEFVGTEYDEGRPMYKYNDEICTFAGDYAAFVCGEQIFLNVVPGMEYTVIEIMDETGKRMSKIKLEGFTKEADGYVDVPITSLNLPCGKYIARLTDSSYTKVSSPTHFELVNIDLNVQERGESVTFYVDGGIPLYLTQEGVGGGGNVRYFLTNHDRMNGSATLGWDAKNQYIKLFVKADYGVVTKRIKVA